MKGHIKICKITDTTEFIFLVINQDSLNIDSDPDYICINVSYMNGLATFENNDDLLVCFAKIGDIGD